MELVYGLLILVGMVIVLMVIFGIFFSNDDAQP